MKTEKKRKKRIEGLVRPQDRRRRLTEGWSHSLTAVAVCSPELV